MNILIVGNVTKDVYLSVDKRTESLEVDKNSIEWLNLSFDSSAHHFYHRVSTFGGAAITLEILSHFSIPATISGSSFSLTDDPDRPTAFVSSYRYILTSEESACYFSETSPLSATFSEPVVPPEYIFIDRSANLDSRSADAISSYLSKNPSVRLVVYLKDTTSPALNTLAGAADLIFTEVEDAEQLSVIFSSTDDSLAQISPLKVIYLSEHAITWDHFTEPISVNRISKMTHLSLFSCLSATILASHVRGDSIETALTLARLNAENAKLSASLPLSELEYLASRPASADLELIAATLMARGKGILAIDESPATLEKRFQKYGIPDTYSSRHFYHNLLLTTPDLEKSLNGVILSDEIIQDRMDSQVSIPDYLISKRIIPGIRVDQGQAPMNPLSEDTTTETITRSPSDLTVLLDKYYDIGLRFAKWRAAFQITINEAGEILTPSAECIHRNCQLLTDFAKKAQLSGLVPILEPEVLSTGPHTIEASAKVTSKVLRALVKELESNGINLRACIFKINMVTPGDSYTLEASPSEIAQLTADVLNTCLPINLGGVVFLSGGQSPQSSAENLSAIIKAGPYPFPISFAFSRALENPALAAWRGLSDNLTKSQEAFLSNLLTIQSSLL